MPAFPIKWPVERQRNVADGFIIATAVALPWSTSAVGILGVLWLLALIPLVDWADLRRTILSHIGGLPVLLLFLGAVGTVWTDAGWTERWDGLSGFVKLLAIPLLIVQFRRSERGGHVLFGFLVSCLVLLVASVVWAIWPGLPTGSLTAGVPVKNYIVQSLEFTVCAAVLADLALERARVRAWGQAVGLAALAVAFLADMAFIATGRTALAVIPVLVVLYGYRHGGWRGLLATAAAGIALAGVIWTVSPYLRARVIGVYHEVTRFEEHNAATSAGERIAFWMNAVKIIESAPVLGHGTGSTKEQFARVAAGHTGPLGEVSANPHNQTLAVGIQLGFLGMLVLWAMWIAQVAVFWRPGLTAWIGLVVVTENVVGSLFNTLIFDFTEGWLYVLGVGVVGGMLARESGDRQSR